MATTKVYNPSTANINLEAELQRLYDQAHMCQEKEMRTLAKFGLRDGMSLLEVGSGPGFVTEWLANMLPNGSMTCVEIDPVLINHARQYLGDKLDRQPRFIEGSIMHTGIPDNSMDFAFARLVFEHLTDQVGAAREIARVLKPGGKLVVAEGDFAVNVLTDPVVPEAEAIREKLMQYQTSIGGNTMTGRRLWRIFKRAGLENFDFEAVISHSGDKGLEWFYPQFNPDRMTPLVKQGYLTKEEQESLRAAVDKFVNEDDGFYMKIMLVGCGEKPAQIGK